MATRKGRHRRPGTMAVVITASKSTFIAGTAATAILAAAAQSPADAQVTSTAQAVRGAQAAQYDVTSAVIEAVTVRPGDYLSLIAARYCPSPRDWPGIYDANRAVIGPDPDRIAPGEVLAIRCAPGLQAHRQQAVTLTSSSTRITATSSFQACVIQRESGGNPYAQNPSSTASGLYGFLDSTWTAVTGLPGPARDYSVAEQDAAFEKAYAEDGTSPWAPWDGCL